MKDESWAIEHFGRMRKDPAYRRQVQLSFAKQMRCSNLHQCRIFRDQIASEKIYPPVIPGRNLANLKNFQREHLLKTRRNIQDLIHEIAAEQADSQSNGN